MKTFFHPHNNIKQSKKSHSHWQTVALLICSPSVLSWWSYCNWNVSGSWLISTVNRGRSDDEVLVTMSSRCIVFTIVILALCCRYVCSIDAEHRAAYDRVLECISKGANTDKMGCKLPSETVICDAFKVWILFLPSLLWSAFFSLFFFKHLEHVCCHQLLKIITTVKSVKLEQGPEHPEHSPKHFRTPLELDEIPRKSEVRMQYKLNKNLKQQRD